MEVTVRFTIEHGEHKEFQCIVKGNVLENVQRLSLAFPGETLQVWAMCRARLWVKDGEVVREEPHIERYYLPDKDTEYWAKVRHDWTNLNAGCYDPVPERAITLD